MSHCMNHYINIADFPAMCGESAKDVQGLARYYNDYINSVVDDWEEGETLHHEISDYEGDVEINGYVRLCECGDWRGYGDEQICMRYYKPEIEDINLTFTICGDNQQTIMRVTTINELSKLAG